MRRFPMQSISLTEVLQSRCPDLDIAMPSWSADLRAGNIQDSFAFAALVRAFKPARYFEIGTGDGRTSLLAAANSGPDAKIHTLDLHYSEYPQIGSLYKQRPEGAKVTQFSGSSADFDFSKFKKSMDLVFIDGGHEIEDVVRDTHIAFDIARDGGCILWHDLLYESREVIEGLHLSGYVDRIYQVGGTAYGICPSV